MAAIHGILKEELERLKSLSKKYIDEINKLPKGCISLKERKGHLGIFLVYPVASKVNVTQECRRR